MLHSTPRSTDSPLLPRVQLILAMLLAGSSVVFSKVIAASVPTLLANTLILLLASGVLLLLTWRSEGGLRVPRSAWRSLIVQALCGVVLFRVLLFYGLPLTSAASAGLLTSATPALATLLAWLLLRERLSTDRALGVAFTTLGILILTVPGASSGAGSHPLLGNLMVLGAAGCEAVWTVLSKRSGAALSPLVATTLVTLLALGLFFPLAVGEALHFNFMTLPVTAVLALLYYALGATVLAYLLWFAGVRRLGAGTAAVYTSWLPVSAVACSALVLREPLTLWHALGLGCVLCATLVSARHEPPSKGVRNA